MNHTDRMIELYDSTDMEPINGEVDVDIPAKVLWEAFCHPEWWSLWNRAISWAPKQLLKRGRPVVFSFQPIRSWYPYKLPVIATVVELVADSGQAHLTWEVTALPGFYACHRYYIYDLGDGRCRFGSWEQAMGPTFRGMRSFWQAHFRFVKDRSLQGARMLEALYRHKGRIHGDDLAALPRGSVRAALTTMRGVGELLHFRAQELATGVHAILGASNSVVVEDAGEALLIDTKFPPFSLALKWWLGRNIQAPIERIVNTHYHYDHTQGNVHYPAAEIMSHERVPTLMKHNDGSFWRHHATAMPLSRINHGATLRVGALTVQFFHPGAAHTGGDLWFMIRRDTDTGQGGVRVENENKNRDQSGDQAIIIGLGDFLIHGYYPFLDMDGGVDVPTLIDILAQLATEYPGAIFVPGHGPIAQAKDLKRYSDYLRFLYHSVTDAHDNGLSEAAAVANIDLSMWNLAELPVLHYGRVFVGANDNIRWMCQLVQRDRRRQDDKQPEAARHAC